MGILIRFFTIGNDENKLINYIFSFPEAHILPTRSKDPGLKVLDDDMQNFLSSKNVVDFLIWSEKCQISNNDIIEGRKRSDGFLDSDTLNTGQVFYFVSTNAPVIEFSRSFIRNIDNKLVQGRIWCDFFRLAGNRFEYKGDEFKEFYTEIAAWIRKHFKKLKGVDGYFGPEALEWYKKGGILFP